MKENVIVVRDEEGRIDHIYIPLGVSDIDEISSALINLSDSDYLKKLGKKLRALI